VLCFGRPLQQSLICQPILGKTGHATLPRCGFSFKAQDDKCLNLLGDVEEPPKHLLVGQPVQWPGEAVEAGRERVVGVRQRAANEVCRVRADVAALVVGVDCLIEAR
jgi:hypothetical protein